MNMINFIKNCILFLKSNITIFFLIVIALLCSITYTQCERKNNLKLENGILLKNQNAYENENSKLKKTNYMFEFSIKQLESSNDTIAQELMKTKKALGIKDKEIKGMASIISKLEKRDTITLNDTIFIDQGFRLDTTISDDKWYSTNVILEYPGTIIVDSKFTSQKEIFVADRKKTINEPKKFFLFRLFQKKQTVSTIDVVEKNPYITKGTERFVKIIE